MQFSGKKILVTGGTSGIGLATAKRLVDQGAQVIVTGTNAKRLQAAAESLGDRAKVIANDAGDPGAVADLVAAIESTFGQLDGAFLNAGFGKFMPLSDSDADAFDAQFNVNVRGVLQHARAIAERLQDRGSVVVTGSIVQDMGMPNGLIYSATKGAVRTLVRGLAATWAPRGIRVNAISPGPIETNFFEGSGMSEEEAQAFAEGIASQVPLGRFGRADEVAAVACFLLSDDASYVTGSDYVVDGGMGSV